MEKKGTLIWECKLVQPFWKTVWLVFITKTKAAMIPCHDPEIQLLEKY
jgi:hypothetical protein